MFLASISSRQEPNWFQQQAYPRSGRFLKISLRNYCGNNPYNWGNFAFTFSWIHLLWIPLGPARSSRFTTMTCLKSAATFWMIESFGYCPSARPHNRIMFLRSLQTLGATDISGHKYRRRTNVQQLTCNIDLSRSFYYLFLLFCYPWPWAKALCFEEESPGGKVMKKCE